MFLAKLIQSTVPDNTGGGGYPPSPSPSPFVCILCLHYHEPPLNVGDQKQNKIQQFLAQCWGSKWNEISTVYRGTTYTATLMISTNTASILVNTVHKISSASALHWGVTVGGFVDCNTEDETQQDADHLQWEDEMGECLNTTIRLPAVQYLHCEHQILVRLCK